MSPKRIVIGMAIILSILISALVLIPQPHREGSRHYRPAYRDAYR
jgi:hypothetical protein